MPWPRRTKVARGLKADAITAEVPNVASTAIALRRDVPGGSSSAAAAYIRTIDCGASRATVARFPGCQP